MKVKLLKKVLGRGEMTMYLTVGVIVSRFVLDRLTARAEKMAARETSTLGQPEPRTEKRVRALRMARGLVHIL